jgi:hypothetical protein
VNPCCIKAGPLIARLFYFNFAGIHMSLIPNIRSLYTPVQPAVKNNGAQALYNELPPHTGLAPFIYCYWQLTSQQPLSCSFQYRVVADGCIDLFFETAAPADIFIMGFSAAYTEFPLTGSFRYTGVRFLPAAFPLLFGMNAATLTNRFENLQQVLPGLAAAFRDAVAGETVFEPVTQKLNILFLKLWHHSNLKYDNRFFEAVECILKKEGNLNIQADINTGISPRQLRRLFEYYIGDTPKMFSRVVRFQQILKSGASAAALRKNKLFFDAGYYDQAHFIKEFRTFFGDTPALGLQ